MKLLVVVDMQNDFITGSLGSKSAEKIKKNVIRKMLDYIESGEMVVLTKDTHGEAYLDTMEGRNLPIIHCVKGTNGWEFIDEIKNLKEKYSLSVFEKPSFASKDLAAFVDGINGLEEIELIGLCTDICVISNALLLKSFFHELSISVDSRCCAGVSEDSHEAALTTMRMCQIEVK
ncbi:MAG: cysteine hydrolase family protein [Filifactoraceae bacterium]